MAVPSAERDRSGSDPIGYLIAHAVLVMQQALGDELSFAERMAGQRAGYGGNRGCLSLRSRCNGGGAGRHFAGAIRIRHVAWPIQFPPRVRQTCRGQPSIPGLPAGCAFGAGRRGPARYSNPLGRCRAGDGCAGNRRLWPAILESLHVQHAGAWGQFAKDKYWASQLLRDAGLPAPRSMLVRSLDAAKRAALEIGYPVVLKPNLGSQGRDVFVDVRDESELAALYESSLGRRASFEWLLEQFVPGNEHRVLVVGGKVVAANRRIPASVTGDGNSTVQALIDRLNADPDRSFESGFALKPVTIGEQLHQMLRRRGCRSIRSMRGKRCASTRSAMSARAAALWKCWIA